MSGSTLIKTARFTVREFTEHDREAFIACHLDPKFSQFHLESERGAAHASAVFDLFLIWQREEPRKNHQFAIAPNEDPRAYIGNVGVRTGEMVPGEAELGVELISSYWGNGAATEIMEAVVPWAARRLNLTSFVAETAVDNVAAQRLAQKVGLHLHHEGEKCTWRSG